jgi:sporulation protein YlmC with PRC-barrel domain
MMDTSKQPGTLVTLSDTSLTVADPQEDVRNRTVIDRNGEEIGKVDDLLLDERENRVRFLRVAHGGLLGIGQDHYLIPVDAVTGIDEDNVHIDRERGNRTGAPGYDPELAKEPDYYTGVYGWWGCAPYWSPGYTHPAFPGRPV